MADTRRTAVVTGAGSGIGRATCVRLSRRGYAVACLDLRGEAAGETATTIRDAGGEAWAVPVDVGVEPQVAAAIVHLASPEAGSTTGAVLRIDGGAAA